MPRLWTVVLAGVLLAPLAPQAAAYQAKPLPAASKARTARQEGQAYLAFLVARMSGAYREFGRRDPAWDAEAIAFLEASAQVFADAPGAPTARELLAAGDAAARRGCRDPLFSPAGKSNNQQAGKT